MGAREGVEWARMQKWVQQSDNSLGKVPKKWGCHLWSGIDWKRWELGEIPARPLLCAKTKQKKNGEGEKKKALSKDGFSSGRKYLCWNIPQHSLPGHGTWIGEHWKVE